MSKVIWLVSLIMFILIGVSPLSSKYSKYRSVEAYEVRPGILMMPRYASDGQVCEIGLEKRRYSPDAIYLDSHLSRQDIDQIVNELIPMSERGHKSEELGGMDLIVEGGHAITTYVEYEHISIQIVARDRPNSDEGDFAATILWKDRKCQTNSPKPQ